MTKQAKITDTLDQQVQLLKDKKNIILQGAPGTGKTYTTASLAVCLCNSSFTELEDHAKVMAEYERLRKEGQIAFCTFHQSMDYEDFVEGLKPEVQDGHVTYQVESGIFKRICEQAHTTEDDAFSKPHVLIIDEINRGNISRIFGELITLLEADKRAGSKTYPITVTLPYSKENFSVPSNLYIIGTMNTTDRSTGAIDYAVRRRFAFITLKTDPEVIKTCIKDDELRTKALDLFKQINGDGTDDKASFIVTHQAGDFDLEDLKVGHSYFLAETLEALQMKMRYEVIPLLREYIKDGILQGKNRDESYFEAWEKGECFNTSVAEATEASSDSEA
jgi:mcrBC restriction endonuclease system, mcrB subunit, putative